MSADHLTQMGIDVERAHTVANFLEAYANTAERELQEILESSGDTALSYGGPPLQQEPAFSVAADAASALREAAQWLFYLDAPRAQALLLRSGRLFHGMGQAFGLFLRILAEEWETASLADLLGPAVNAMRRRRTADLDIDEQALLWEPAMQYPHQQAYLLLASYGSRYVPEVLEPDLVDALERSPHRDGTAPVGALGTPIRRLWDIAGSLHDRGPAAPNRIAHHLVSMCQRYEETMSLANVNAYLWRNGAAPVDIGDIDIVGITALATRIFGRDAMLSGIREPIPTGQTEPARRPSLGPVALAPFEAGLDLADVIA